MSTEARLAVNAVLDAGGEADDVLRGGVDALVASGACSWAAIMLAESGGLVLGPAAGTEAPEKRTRVAVTWDDARVGELVADGCDDDALLKQVAARLGPLCLVAWDTGGEPWEP
jgi:hypothetical protein